MAVAAHALLDFSKPVDVDLLESTVGLFYGAGTPEQRTAAEQVLKTFQENPDAWTRVDTILEKGKTQQTKFFALQILESVIKFKWAALPGEQREGIKNYTSNLIIKYSTNEQLYRAESTFISKLNLILVQILKQDWPHKWQSFIPDLVAASKTNETLCENSMHILKLLSEEVFDFSRGELTQAKTRELKLTLNNEFRSIHELCMFVLLSTRKTELLRATLTALAAYLSWVPPGYIFESQLVTALLGLFPQAPFRNVALQCLTEVGSLQMPSEFDAHFGTFYRMFSQQLVAILPPNTNLAAAYEAGTDEQQAFVQNLALFYTGFFKHHIQYLEGQPADHEVLRLGLENLINISYVDDTEVFKTCLDYWNVFVADIYTSSCQASLAATTGAGVAGDGSFSFASPGGSAANGVAGSGGSRKALYAGVLSKLRALMVNRMAKPEEVIVVEDENGNIVRETMKDNDVLMQYRTMRETLIYLSHLDYEDTELQMLEKLRGQMSGSWTWNGLNTLCWAIGSISGSMHEEQENRFLVTVIRDLLNLCEITRGKDNKAVIASNIMYVVGQYPKFLRAHWKFLKTVVNKLFEFMHETHPGVQDMACDTFLKISNKCKRKFVVLQLQEQQPFVAELLDGLTATIQDLQPHQIHSFFESVGLMIGAEVDPAKREEYLSRLMAPPNNIWGQILAQAQANPAVLQQQEVIKSLQNVLQTNVSVCSSLGHPYLSQMVQMADSMLQVYRLYSESISQAIASGGPHAARSSFVKYMRSVKKSVLRLIEVFVDKCDDAQLLATKFVPALMEPVLGDYAASVPDAREAEVLSLFAAIVRKLKALMEPEVPKVLSAVFEPTLGMITANFEDFPEHRLKFFGLLHAITNHCFACLFGMSPPQLKLLIDSIVWAFRHTERNVAETGLLLLEDMLKSFAGSEYATQFHQTYYTLLTREVFAVMTDTFHTPGLKLHCRILLHLFGLVRTDAVIKAPLWDVAAKGPSAYASNAAFVQEYVCGLLAGSFPNMTPVQVQAAVAGMMALEDKRAFKHHMRDFLVQTKAFGNAETDQLYADETASKIAEAQQRLQAIPGMVPPNQVNDDMADA
eukprot:GHRQ01001297.1.p1 GENE.GHRQ01001297.1~~GHRQ01001297.1.p1  ORF type:complete len:1084 (+),score=646.45 GHRQ01001297.1:232-3483(+)